MLKQSSSEHNVTSKLESAFKISPLYRVKQMELGMKIRAPQCLACRFNLTL